MPGYILDSGATITCPHGGQASIVPRSTHVLLGGKAPLLVDDIATISGCSFNISGAPSPCLSIQWMMPATRVMVESSPVLLSSSVSPCLSGAQVPQGTAQVSGYQTKVQAQ